MERKFAVIEFTAEKSVALVPKCWLFDCNSKCFWPPLKGQSLKTAIKRAIGPEKNWAVWEARLIRQLDDYNRGLKLVSKAEETSDLDTTDDEYPSSQRVTQTPQKSDLLYQNEEIIPATPDQLLENNSNLDLEFEIEEPFGSLLPLEGSVPITHIIDVIDSHNPIDVVEGRGTISANTSSHFQNELTEIRGMVAEHLVKIKEGIREIQNFNPATTSSKSQSIYTDLISRILIDDKEKLANFSSWIDCADNLLVLKSYLGSVGGSSVGNVTRCILMKLIGRELAVGINFTGANNKISFGSSRLYGIVIESVRKNFKGTVVTEEEISRVMKNWFRGAQDRNGGRKRPTSEQRVNAN
ncbi:unnamed protein product [Allacma fusca]|uniref:DUF4806 domain-containing protein n=1 Tax=Allacma fusca TaxID=39272 RepID=A0A8J2JGX3_9HEXA|nr:unnamed protein product [Allacma fusca]